MPDRKNTDMETSDTHGKLDSVAERYLDLWQDNVKRWATDPNALNKWLMEAAKQLKSPD